MSDNIFPSNKGPARHIATRPDAVTSARLADGIEQAILFDVITLLPHRSLSHRGFSILIMILAGLAFFISLGFFLIGAWPVIGFMGLELLVLYVAFRLNYRDGKRLEQLVIHNKGLELVRITPSGSEERLVFSTLWLTAEIQKPKGKRNILGLRHHGTFHEIGAFLPPVEKKQIKNLINDTIAAARLMPE